MAEAAPDQGDNILIENDSPSIESESDPSLVIVDMEADINDLEDASHDLEEDEKETEEPVPEGTPIQKVPDSLQMSQYAQVIFHDVKEKYFNNTDMECIYTITSGVNTSPGDRIGLYRLPFLEPHEYLIYAWAANADNGASGRVVFEKNNLPKMEDYYQFQYIKSDGSVAGASIPWQLISKDIYFRPSSDSDIEVAFEHDGSASSRSVTPADDLVVVQTPFSSLREENDTLNEKVKTLEDKFSDMLKLNEKLNEELAEKQSSYDQLDSQLRSVSSVKDTDIMKLVADKLKLEQDLNKLNESLLEANERLIDTRSSLLDKEEAMAAIKNDLASKTKKISDLEAQLLKADMARKSFEDRIREFDKAEDERHRLKAMLDKELLKSESHVTEQQALLSKYESCNAMLDATQKSKEVAIKEMRNLIEVQDTLSKSLSFYKKEVQRLESDNADLQRQLMEKMNPNGDVQEVLKNMGLKIDNLMREVGEKDDKIRALEEKCNGNEVVDKTAEVEALKEELEDKKVVIIRLTQEMKENQETVVAKLAEQESTLIKLNQTKEELNSKIQELEQKNQELSRENAKMLANINQPAPQVSMPNPSLSSFVTLDGDGSEPTSTISGNSNLDSLRIQSFVQAAQRLAHPVLRGTAQVAPFVPSQQRPAGAQGGGSEQGPQQQANMGPGNLPPPLVPDNVDPTPSIPELRKREPAREFEVHTCKPKEGECPYCKKKFQDMNELMDHVMKHSELECPMCYSMFDDLEALQKHVHTHFDEDGDQASGFSIPDFLD